MQPGQALPHPAQHTDALCSPAALCGLWLVPSAAGPSKGVQLLHGALQHFLAWYTKRLGLTAEDRVGHIPGPMPTTALLDLCPGAPEVRWDTGPKLFRVANVYSHSSCICRDVNTFFVHILKQFHIKLFLPTF